MTFDLSSLEKIDNVPYNKIIVNNDYCNVHYNPFNPLEKIILFKGVDEVRILKEASKLSSFNAIMKGEIKVDKKTLLSMVKKENNNQENSFFYFRDDKNIASFFCLNGLSPVSSNIDVSFLLESKHSLLKVCAGVFSSNEELKASLLLMIKYKNIFSLFHELAYGSQEQHDLRLNSFRQNKYTAFSLSSIKISSESQADCLALAKLSKILPQGEILLVVKGLIAFKTFLAVNQKTDSFTIPSLYSLLMMFQENEDIFKNKYDFVISHHLSRLVKASNGINYFIGYDDKIADNIDLSFQDEIYRSHYVARGMLEHNFSADFLNFGEIIATSIIMDL